MKKVFILGLSFALTALHAQSYIPSREDIETFFHTKTLVVLEDNPMSAYNAMITDVMDQEWKITEVGYISEREFDEKRSDPSCSFIYTAEVMFENDRTDARYRFLHLSLGGDYYRLNEMPDIASVPLAYAGVDEDSYAYKLAVLVRFMQHHAELIREHPEIVSSNVLNYYNRNMREIRDKTLYLRTDELAPGMRSPAAIRKVYPYAFQLVSMEEIEEAIRSRDPSVVFLHKVGPEGTKINARSYKVVIGAENANFYYFDYHKISEKNPDGLLESDFKKMGR